MIEKVIAQSGGYQYEFELSASANAGALIFDFAGIAEHSREITVDKLYDRTVISGIAPKQRVITLSIRIVAVDVEHERKTLRQIFAEGNTVYLSIVTDLVPMRTIQGTVESCNTPVFSKESTMTVTVICPTASFYADTVTMSLDGVVSAVNPGDIPSGCVISVILDGSVTTGIASIINVPGNSMTLDMAKVNLLVGGIQNGDTLIVDSRFKKRCVLTRGSTTTNIFSAVVVPYSWIMVNPGAIEIDATGFGGSKTLEYRPRYGSI